MNQTAEMMKVNTYTVGIACEDGLMNTPYLMKSDKPIIAKTFAEARDIFLSDPSVAKAKCNDIVMCLASGSDWIEA